MEAEFKVKEQTKDVKMLHGAEGKVIWAYVNIKSLQL